MWSRMQFEGMRIGVFGKGGSGKTTVVVLLARLLLQEGHEVCVLDADSTNVGLAQALGLREPPAELLQLFGGMVFSGGLVTCPVDDPTPLPGASVDLADLPGQYRASDGSGLSLLVAGKLASHGSGAGCDGPVIKIARDLRVTEESRNLVTLIDFKAGFEDSARGVVTGLDVVLVVVDPTRTAIRLAIDMTKLVDEIKKGGLPATRHLKDPGLVDLANRLYNQARTKHVVVVLNKVPDQDTAAYMLDELQSAGIEPVAILKAVPAIEGAWLRGETLDVAELMVEGGKILEALELLVEAGSGRA